VSTGDYKTWNMEWNMEWICNEALTCKQQTKHHTCLVTPQWPLGGVVQLSSHITPQHTVLVCCYELSSR